MFVKCYILVFFSPSRKQKCYRSDQLFLICSNKNINKNYKIKKQRKREYKVEYKVSYMYMYVRTYRMPAID